ncbi:DUF7373 family lipoprotein [Nocardia xishanensis]|uniref:DUF7373 family lipoprotein n=1 Tax=Nocardia xishanensis TaxID=238964 RepID=UPI003415E0A9
MNKRFWPAALLAAALFVGTGCGSTITGNPKPGLSPVDLSSLKTGANATEPSAFELRFVSPAALNVRFIEARRMLNHLIHPFDVDEDLSAVGYVRLMADPASMIVDGALPKFYRPVAEENKLVAGAYVSRTNGNLRNSKKLIVSILRFQTEQDSKKAADDFYRITQEQGARHSIQVEGYPDAHASSPDDLTANAFLAQGPYVIVTSIGVPQPNSTELAERIKKTFDLQRAKLSQLQPIPVDDLLDLPIDPGGIMRRAAPKAKDYSDPFMLLHEEDFGAFEPSGILHFERNPLEVRRAFEEGGVDLIGRRASTVYRARDVEAAFRLQTALAKPEKDDIVLDPPPGLNDAQCLQIGTRDLNRSFTSFCAVVYDRYVAVVISSIPDLGRVDRRLQERTAAQYSILVKSEQR